MQTLLALLRLIRWSNLIIVAFAQSIIWYFVNINFHKESVKSLNGELFILLLISTLLIAAAGYIINDYFDIKIDTINHPDTVIVTRDFTMQRAILFHLIFSLLGFFFAVIVAHKLGQIYLVTIQITTIPLLWFYSTHFKKMVIVGNVIVALLTSLSLLLMLIYDPALYQYLIPELIIESGHFNPAILIISITFFAFILNWMREIVKDMEDFKGDAELGCTTFPIKYGLGKSALLVQIIGWSGIMALCIGCYYLLINDEYFFVILLLILSVFILYAIMRLPRHADVTHYAKISRLLKIIMVAGLVVFAIISSS